MKIRLLNTSQGLIPLYDEDYENKKKLKIGEVYEVSITLSRNYLFHKKYFSLINVAWGYLNEKQQMFFNNNPDVFRKSIEVTSGHCIKIYNYKLQSWVDMPKSIAFNEMCEDEFQELYNNVLNVLRETYLKNLSDKEINNILENFG